MVQFQNIPEQLKHCRFCCWKRILRNGNMTKFPINPLTGKAACTNDLGTFGTFDQAKAAYDRGYYDGVGILVDRIAAFDIDHCITFLIASKLSLLIQCSMAHASSTAILGSTPSLISQSESI